MRHNEKGRLGVRIVVLCVCMLAMQGAAQVAFNLDTWAEPEDTMFHYGYPLTITVYANYAGACITYTTDGSDPPLGGGRICFFSGDQFPDTFSIFQETTLKIRATKTSNVDTTFVRSDIKTYHYDNTPRAPGIALWPGNPFDDSLVVTLSPRYNPFNEDEQIRIYYSLQDPTPDTNAILYSTPLVFYESDTLYAVAEKEGYYSDIILQYIKKK